MAKLTDRSVLRLVQLALSEDIGTGDLTSESLVDSSQLAHGVLLVKQTGVLCGTILAGLVFGEVDRDVVLEWTVEEGAWVEQGTVVAHLRGPARSILTAERTALNFMQRMSGVATLTRAYVEKIAGTGATILDTRKTIPAWRLLDKYSVKVGGGENHRMGLFDMVMIKDNHIAAHGSIGAAVDAVHRYFDLIGTDGVPIEVETQSIEQVAQALAAPGVTRIMFDNFSPESMEGAVALVGGERETEASGGITLDTVRRFAETGVDYISVGALTHSAPALDISLDFESGPRPRTGVSGS